MMKKYLALSLVPVLLVECVEDIPSDSTPDNIIYVNVKNREGGDGSSWAGAVTDLQSALEMSEPGQEIWVAKGSYYPSRDTADMENEDKRMHTFRLRNGVALYGGFNGTESRREKRDYRQNTTVLDGDIGVENDSTDNTYHVVYCGNGDSVFIDGFTVQNGKSLKNIAYSFHVYGGGLYSDSCAYLSVKNCTFRNNSAEASGGAIGIIYSRANLSDLTFEHNYSHNSGGGVGANRSLLTISGCHFKNNYAKFGSCIDDDQSRIIASQCSFVSNVSVAGGAIYTSYSKQQKINSLYINGVFRKNVSRHGADIVFGESNDTILNCTFISAHDTMYSIAPAGAFPVIKNCLFYGYQKGGINSMVDVLGWGKPKIGNSLFTDPTLFQDSNMVDIGGNIFATPVFTHAENGDYSLTAKSPGVNGGDNSAVREGMEKDFAGNPRIAGSAVDIGAYEYQE
jgi:hypothetical protein